MTTLLEPNDPKKAAEYFERKIAFTLGPMELQYYRDEGRQFVLIDVRDPEDFAESHIPGAINLPEDRWSSFGGLARDRMNILYCYSNVCHLASNAALQFSKAGFPVMEMEGGFDAWEDHELDVEIGSSVLKPSSWAA
jgi:rhodanese-related sulfurtransferase